ncbi:hypothetical protein FDW47_07630 [Campylobacter helveticus]|uniref:hypothetical protein n=1 Tax=Campylobacter helveticus TaxID=28898 RepID=UPI0011118DCC|nr:hypothetical protein [Campylobacter helveticus]TNB54444.1 hypothetical protein FDW47_07630 [Campylobacter helveticus]
MKEKAKIILEQNIELLNSIHNIVEFFKKHKNLTSYENSFNLGNNESYEYFHLSFIRSKKYNDCLDFTINNHTHRKLVFEEVEYKEILKTLILVLINIYKLKDFENLKDNNPLNNMAQESLTAQNASNHKANQQEKKSFYVEK